MFFVRQAGSLRPIVNRPVEVNRVAAQFSVGQVFNLRRIFNPPIK